jgi:hypothetical protein
MVSNAAWCGASWLFSLLQAPGSHWLAQLLLSAGTDRTVNMVSAVSPNRIILIVCFWRPIHELAKFWSDVIHPHSPRRIPVIPHLQVIKGFCCADIFRQYQTVPNSSWVSLNWVTNHANPFSLGSWVLSVLPGLSSCLIKAQYFPVYPLDDFPFH